MIYIRIFIVVAIVVLAAIMTGMIYWHDIRRVFGAISSVLRKFGKDQEEADRLRQEWHDSLSIDEKESAIMIEETTGQLWRWGY